jgi:hypothetical protein
LWYGAATDFDVATDFNAAPASEQSGLRNIVEEQFFNYSVIAAFVLLLGVSGGIGYLTIAEWRDRRRREAEARENRPAQTKSFRARKPSKKGS